MAIWSDVVGYALTLVCGVLSFVLGVSTNFLGLFEEQTNASFASLAVSFLIVFVGERITCGLRDRTAVKLVGDKVERALARVPLLDVVVEFPDCNDALDYLCARLPYARAVFNTRISNAGVQPRTDIGSRWAKATIRHVKERLVFKDIVSPAFQEYANQIAAACEASSGRYEYAVLDNTPPSYLNFIVLEYQNGDTEVLIGWATSVYRGMEQRAYKIRDKRIIAYFSDYHSQLYMLAKRNAS